MSEILIFAGTTEGRRLSECLAAAGTSHTVCVATEYGEAVLRGHPLCKVHCGRMEPDGIREFIRAGDYAAVVDATHPYAGAVTENIRYAMRGMKIPRFRLSRAECEETAEGKIRYFDSDEACLAALEKTEGKILLTTGSKELPVYCACGEVKGRLYVRVLPTAESISLCREQGVSGKRVIAMQGPFSAKLNEAILREYGISYLVTKESGISGGFPEKREAAKKAGVWMYVIGRRAEPDGQTFSAVVNALEKICGRKLVSGRRFVVTLAGVGMGRENGLTEEVRSAIAEADVLFGAQRMIAPYQPRVEKKPFYRAEEMIAYLRKRQDGAEGPECRNVVVLFSGDSGFYSGSRALCRALKEEAASGRLSVSVRVLPGISCIAYLASCIGESYEDAAVLSMHGKEITSLARRIKKREKTFLLMSGVSDVRRLGCLLTEAGLDECEVTVGYQMSYPEQEILKMTPAECRDRDGEGLYTCFVRNPHAVPQALSHGLCDGELVRGRVPMTKEEVREICVCKLRLKEGAVVYDIGSGTGSVAVEIAGLSEDIRVYAVERKTEAAALIRQNREKFLLENIAVTEGEAPEALAGLPAATHAFIGGSGGRLGEILSALYCVNPAMRVVLTAVSVETIGELAWLSSLYPAAHMETVQIQVSRARQAGGYHLMRAENPVWICAFDFVPEEHRAFREGRREDERE